MQDRYAGDVGDFAKLGLLRALCGETIEDGKGQLRLGVIWYLVDGEGERTGDGRHVDYLAPTGKHWNVFRRLDRPLFDGLSRVVRGTRSVEALHASLPKATRCFSETLRFRSRVREDREDERNSWFGRALDTVGGSELVFVDPDTGMLPNKTMPHHRKGPKYVDLKELGQLWERGHSLVVYQHVNRSKKLVAQAQEHVGKLQDALSTGTVFAPAFRRWSSRFFFVVPQPGHEMVLEARLQATLDRWKGQFDDLTPGRKSD